MSSVATSYQGESISCISKTSLVKNSGNRTNKTQKTLDESSKAKSEDRLQTRSFIENWSVQTA